MQGQINTELDMVSSGVHTERTGPSNDHIMLDANSSDISVSPSNSPCVSDNKHEYNAGDQKLHEFGESGGKWSHKSMPSSMKTTHFEAQKATLNKPNYHAISPQSSENSLAAVSPILSSSPSTPPMAQYQVQSSVVTGDNRAGPVEHTTPSSLPSFDGSDHKSRSISRRPRKSSCPVKSLSFASVNVDNNHPGLVFRVPFGEESVDVIRYPGEFDTYAEPGALYPARKRRPSFLVDAAPTQPDLAWRKRKAVEAMFRSRDDNVAEVSRRANPSSELFYSAIEEEELPPRRQRRPSRSVEDDQPIDDDDGDEYLDESDMPKKKKRKPSVSTGKKRRSRNGAEKVCASCTTNATPIWREVKEQWGEGWEDILLCNACGLQWRMCSLRCDKCNYVPRASEKRAKKCTRCKAGVWYRRS